MEKETAKEKQRNKLKLYNEQGQFLNGHYLPYVMGNIVLDCAQSSPQSESGHNELHEEYARLNLSGALQLRPQPRQKMTSSFIQLLVVVKASSKRLSVRNTTTTPTMAPTCNFPGNSDMYGLGIRVGYYLQWYGGLIAAWICPLEIPTLRMTYSFFVASTFLALLIQVTEEANIQVVEIYITLLFTFGSSLLLLPILLWRIVTRCRSRFDPSRFARAPSGSRASNFLNSLLLVAVLAFQTWFWISRVPRSGMSTCSQYGFLFTRIPLDSMGFRVLNLTLSLLLLLIVLGFLIADAFAEDLEKKFKIDEER